MLFCVMHWLKICYYENIFGNVLFNWQTMYYVDKRKSEMLNTVKVLYDACFVLM